MPNPNWSSDNPYGSRERTGFPEYARRRTDNPTQVTPGQIGAVTPPQLDAALAALTLDDLADVTVTTPVTDQVLKYNGTQWINAATGGGGSVTWDDVTGKPTAFPPEAHIHVQSDVTNLTTDLAAKAPLDSPALTGTPTAPTAASGTGTTQIANCEFVNSGFAKKDETNLSGGLYLTGVITPTILAADQNDYAPDAADPGAVWVLTSSAAVNITGLTASTNGRTLYILNNNAIGGAAITLKNQNTASTAGGRFAFAGSADAVIAPQEGITLIRVASRWHSFGK